ncbi:MAG: hypothetical protein FWG05_03275 [Kiritimatiellaeota bacterium]|nr:hypothetical protein [Kiritimatiellota bacterium]
MKCFRYWIRETRSILIGDARRDITFCAGSNVSKEDASRNADETARLIEERIRDPTRTWDSYEACIKEHVAHEIDENNIVTINRYGARVLNTTQYTILDIDTREYTRFSRIFLFRKNRTKETIVAKFKQRFAKYSELGDAFRIYETHSGIRIIGKRYFNPRSERFPAAMDSFDVDSLYAVLCRKQNCYRARLTPKPYRMKIKTMRIENPTDCETEEYAAWRGMYEEASRRYGVVRLWESIGRDFRDDPVIALHDQTAIPRAGCPLA